MIRTVLGLDAAWTAHQPSGVALVQEQGQRWHCLAVVPSYASFLAFAEGHPVDWEARHRGSTPEMGTLLRASARLAGRPVDLIAIDMPLSTEPIGGRRNADQQVSIQYGSRGCAQSWSSWVGLSRTTIYSLIATGEFPRQIVIGPRAVAWSQKELEDWITSKRQAACSADG